MLQDDLGIPNHIGYEAKCIDHSANGDSDTVSEVSLGKEGQGQACKQGQGQAWKEGQSASLG